MMVVGSCGATKAEVALPPACTALPRLPWIDPDNFNAGYVMRSQHLMPKSLASPHWRHSQDFVGDQKAFAAIDLNGAEFRYGVSAEEVARRTPRFAPSVIEASMTLSTLTGPEMPSKSDLAGAPAELVSEIVKRDGGLV